MTLKQWMMMSGLALGLTACADEGTDGHDHSDELTESQLAAWDKAHIAKENPKQDGCNGVSLPDQGDFGGRIALTFDDGPRPATTPKVLEILRKYNAPATFFMVGRMVADAPDLAQEIAEDPNFLLASHSWSHPNFAKLTPEASAKEMDDTIAIIKEHTGSGPEYFRFPYGSSTCGTFAQATERGAPVTGWHIDSADWCFQAGGGRCKKSTFKHVPDDMRDSMANYIMSQLKRSNGGVLLFHDTKSNTVAELDGILSQLVDAGYTFVNLDNTEVFPRLNGETPPERPFVGDSCEDDEACDFTASGRDGFCLSGYCSVPCAGYCPDQGGKAATFCVSDPTEGAAGGVCVSKSEPANEFCAKMEGTLDKEMERFIGASNAAASIASVCIPVGEPIDGDIDE